MFSSNWTDIVDINSCCTLEAILLLFQTFRTGVNSNINTNDIFLFLDGQLSKGILTLEV